MVVRGDAVVALDTAAQTPVHDDVLAFWADECADWRHQAAADARPVAGPFAVDVARVKAQRAMVTMSTASEGWTDHGAAFPAAERLGPPEALPRLLSIAIGIGHCRLLLWLIRFNESEESSAGTRGRLVR
jgi:hypothetical protein